MAGARPIRAGAAAFAAVFATGFVLGTLRVTVVAPRLGETTAVLLELPVMLFVSWRVVRWAVARWQIGAMWQRATMGAVAFALLMAAELGLAILAFGESAAAWAASLVVPPGLYGLLAQIAFAFMPLVTGRRGH